ncbi:MAG: hypothetical protein IJL60_06720 [Clostridiales bacterium]|nr:hypothetical protein [Clostridiales bacterium]MBQ6270345.1 hypothetical protein [Clostridiales bacterium]MBR4009350.1 hypothetical protein [Clostridiales bacterium]
MAQQRKTTSANRSNQRSGSSSKKAPASSRSSKNTQKNVVYEEKEPLYSVIWSYSWGKALYLLLGILVLIGLDFLIAMNHYDLFFTVLGIEIIAAMLIGWIVFIILDRMKQKELSENPDEGSEE